MKALVVDKLSPVVQGTLGQYMMFDYEIFISQENLAKVIGHYDVLLMRVDPVIDHYVLEQAHKLKVIGVGSAGLNHIDLDYARMKGIQVLNAPAMNAESVAELTMGRIIDLLRLVPQANDDVKRLGVWDKYRYLGNELQGKTLGLVALGKIGSRVAELARAFGMKILAFDPFLNDDMVAQRGAEPVSFEVLLEQSDVISLHAPLTKDTRNLINNKTLAKMKQGSYLLNMARGELVDENALYEALSQGKLAGAGSDVMEKEPCKTSPLYQLPNFIITPHIGAQTVEAQHRAGKYMSEQILKTLGLCN